MITVPWPPTTGNHHHLPNRGSGKRFRLDPRIERWRKDVSLLIPPVTFFPEAVDFGIKDIKFKIRYFPPKGKQGGADCGNVDKVLLDALQDAWGVNDVRFRVDQFSWEIDWDNPRIEIEIIEGDYRID